MGRTRKGWVVLEMVETPGRMDTCICTAESLCCPPETLTTLLISYVLSLITKQSCLTLFNPIDCSLPDSSVHGILQEYWSGLPFPTL